MKPRRRLYMNCLKLNQTNENTGYCQYYGEVINFCRKDCPYNYDAQDQMIEGDIKI